VSDPTVERLAGLSFPLPIRSSIERWLQEERFASERASLEDLVERALRGDAATRDELADAFSGPLPIGTGGRRGTCGPGPHRVNVPLLRETAQGLARALMDEGLPRRVAVAYDTRRDSRRFAVAVAEQLARNGIEVLLVDAPRATPLLSFTIRARGCGAGVVISASHNPPSDNGIKIYGPDGAQVLGARDRALMAAIVAASSDPLPDGPWPAHAIQTFSTPDELAAIDGPYLDFVARQGVTGGSLDASGLCVVYSPFHGVGHTAVLPVLRSRGLVPVSVAAQWPDDGEFHTLPSANPEQPHAFAVAREVAEGCAADLVVANDPDADRLGALVRGSDGELAFIDGNRLGVLLLDHVLRHAELPANGWVITTIVSTPLVAAMARARGLEVVDDLLVGFKHHAGLIAEAPQRPCVFACEESHGYLRGNEVRDKDGAIAALLLCEAAAEAKRAGETLLDRLDRIWSDHGYHVERQANLVAKGIRGREAIASLMAFWRANPPRTVAGLPVVAWEDRTVPRATGSAVRDLPGDVLIFTLAGDEDVACRLIVRPSGTEPKAKLYALARWTGARTLSVSAQRERVDAVAERVLAEAHQAAQSRMQASFAP